MNNAQQEVQEIYCDESGFTGNNLLDKSTPFFSYAAVATNQAEAQLFVEEITKEYRVQADELKFQKLVRYNRGRRAITEVLKTFSSQTKVSIYHKKYSLACKFFEYIFEPAIASQSSIFYNIGFHRFIAHLLYFYFEQRNEYAESIFENFLNMMREMNDERLMSVFIQQAPSESWSALSLVKEFCICQRTAINSELDSLRGSGTGKWILDLTDSSLTSLLADWGQECKQMRVFCDRSKPLEEEHPVYRAMVNNDKKLFMELDGEEHPLTYNLVDVPRMVDSKNHPGIQIADIFAGAFTFVYGQRLKGNCDYPNEWTGYLIDSMGGSSVMPDFDNLDFKDIRVKRNYLLLQELTERSSKGLSLLNNIDVFLSGLTQYLRTDQNLRNFSSF